MKFSVCEYIIINVEMDRYVNRGLRLILFILFYKKGKFGYVFKGV